MHESITRRRFALLLGAAGLLLERSTRAALAVPALPPGARDQTAELQAAAREAAKHGAPLDLRGRRVTLSSLRLPAGTTLLVDGAVLTAVRTRPNTGVLVFDQPGCRLVGDVTIDLNRSADRAVEVTRTQDFAQSGTLRLRGARRGSAESFNGGVLVDHSSNVAFDAIVAEDFRQHASRTGFFRAFGNRNSQHIRLGSLQASKGDMAAHFYACDGVEVGSVVAHDLTDNGVYLINQTRNVHLHRLDLTRVEEGIVLNARAGANIVIDEATVRSPSNKAVSLRTGGGYHIGRLVVVNGVIGQSASYGGVNGLEIDALEVQGRVAGRPVLDFRNNSNIVIHRLDVADRLARGHDLVVLRGRSHGLKIDELAVNGDAAALQADLRATKAQVAANGLQIGRVSRRR